MDFYPEDCTSKMPANFSSMTAHDKATVARKQKDAAEIAKHCPAMCGACEESEEAEILPELKEKIDLLNGRIEQADLDNKDLMSTLEDTLEMVQSLGDERDTIKDQLKAVLLEQGKAPAHAQQHDGGNPSKPVAHHLSNPGDTSKNTPAELNGPRGSRGEKNVDYGADGARGSRAKKKVEKAEHPQPQQGEHNPQPNPHSKSDGGTVVHITVAVRPRTGIDANEPDASSNPMTRVNAVMYGQ